MKKKTMLKVLGLAGLSVGLIASSITPILFSTSYQNLSSVKNIQVLNSIINDPNLTEDEKIEELGKEIWTNSYGIEGQKHYIYDGLTFNSEEEVNEYIFNNGQIKSYITSSNPNLIIKDIQSGTLDETKIYDTDIDHFIQVFKDANNQVTLDKETALQSYIGPEKMTIQYSYDGINWFNTQLEAERAAKAEMNISKSYYYVFNDRYYNAFNENDISNLFSTMKDGYYMKIDKSLSGNEISKHEEIFGEKDNFADLVTKYFYSDFSQNYYRELINFEGINKLEVNNKKNQSIIEVYDANGNPVINNNREVDNFVVVFPEHPYSSYDDMLNNFTDKTKWEKKMVEVKYRNIISTGVFFATHYVRNFDLIINGNYKPNMTVEIHHPETFKGWYPVGGWWEDVDLDIQRDLNYIDKTEGKIEFWLDKEKTQPWIPSWGNGNNKIYGPTLTNDQILEFYNAWIDQYLNKVILNFGKDNNTRLTWEKIKNDDFVENKNVKFLAGKIYKDKLYEVNSGKGFTHSLVESMEEWKEKKEGIIFKAKQRPDFDTMGDKKYEIVPGFFVTRNDLDNFLNLEGPEIDARIMYSISSQEHPSDLTGKFLAPTEIQAKELLRLYLNDSLKLRYILHDSSGKQYDPITSDPERAIKKIKSELKIESRFIPQAEYDSWNHDYKQSWDKIVTDGKYTIYSLMSANKKEIFYATKNQVLNALKEKIWNESNLKVFAVSKNYWVYNFLTIQNIVQPIKYKEEELTILARQIYEYELRNR